MSSQVLRILDDNSIGVDRIRDDGASELAKALPHTSSLQELWLRGNSIGDDCKDILRKAAEGQQNFALVI